jgi:hypothetical protein
MKAYIEQLLRDSADPVHGRNRVREYLQARILESLQNEGAMIPLAFQGGTALRFLYAIPRYSEDLDFALERAGAGYNFRGYLRAIQDQFAKEGYQVEIKLSDQKQFILPLFGSIRCSTNLAFPPSEMKFWRSKSRLTPILPLVPGWMLR